MCVPACVWLIIMFSSSDMTPEERTAVILERLKLKKKRKEMYSLWCTELYRLSIANKVCHYFSGWIIIVVKLSNIHSLTQMTQIANHKVNGNFHSVKVHLTDLLLYFSVSWWGILVSSQCWLQKPILCSASAFQSPR